jgi:hypothetical protein
MTTDKNDAMAKIRVKDILKSRINVCMLYARNTGAEKL